MSEKRALCATPDPNAELDSYGGWPGVVSLLMAGTDLSAHQAKTAMGAILSGGATPAQLIAFSVALRIKGETADELSGLLDAVLGAAQLVPLSDELRAGAVDIVGTGGDRSHSINVSTMAALVVAGAGVPVCKHGARGASSQCGTADVLEALGVAHRAASGRGRALRRGGRHRLLLRAAVPSGVPLRRPGPPRGRRTDSCSTCSARWPTRVGSAAS